MIIIIRCNGLMYLSAVRLVENCSIIKATQVVQPAETESRSRRGERSALIISHREGSLIKGNGWSGNFECVFSVELSVSLGDSDRRTDAETIKASRRMFFLLLRIPPPLSVPQPGDCTSKLSMECKSLVYCLTPSKQFLKGVEASGCDSSSERVVITGAK